LAADRRERLTPLYGIVFVVLTVVSIVLSSSESPEEFPGEVREIVEYWENDPGMLIAAGWVGLIGGLFLFLFLGVLVSRMRAVEGGAGRLSATAFAGGVAAGTSGLMIDTVSLAGALRAEEDGVIPPQTATALYDISQMIVGAALPFSLAVLIAATAALALRTSFLPRWFGIVSIVLALGLLILPISWAFTALALLWALVVSILLYLRPADPGPGAAPVETGRTTPA
jgi:hypothetical protein